MAIFGDLSDMSTPEILNMLGLRIGKLVIRPTSAQKYEIHLREGVIHCLKDNGYSVLDTTALRHRVTDLLGMRAGGFEFNQTAPSALEYEVNFTRNEIWQIAASLEADEGATEHIPDAATRFRLKSAFDTEVKLPEDIRNFVQRSHELLFAGCSAGELAEALSLPVPQVQLYFQRLRSLDRITPVRAYAANYGSYSHPVTVPAAVAAPGGLASPVSAAVAAARPSSYSRPVASSAPAKSHPPSAPRPRQNFVRRLLSVLSFGGK